MTRQELTLRDHFAIAALSGLVANVDYDSYDKTEVYARDAYAIADAMIIERDRKVRV